jgi:hypothetical protein
MRKLTTLVAALALLSGCYTSHQTRRVVTQPQLSATDLTFATADGKSARAGEIIEVELHDGSVVEFEGSPSLDDDLVLRGNAIASRDESRVSTAPAAIPWTQVRSVAVQQKEKKFDAVNTLLAIAIPVGLLALVAASWDMSFDLCNGYEPCFWSSQ